MKQYCNLITFIAFVVFVAFFQGMQILVYLLTLGNILYDSRAMAIFIYEEIFLAEISEDED